MDEIIGSLKLDYLWSSILYSLGIFMVVYFLRTIIQAFWKGWRQSDLYQELALPLTPIVLGGLLAWLFTSWPWPDLLLHSPEARVIWGGILGMFSGVLYSRVRKMIELYKLNIKGLPPPPSEGGLPPSDDVSPEKPVHGPYEHAPEPPKPLASPEPSKPVPEPAKPVPEPVKLPIDEPTKPDVRKP
jgi:hypothetical protein